MPRYRQPMFPGRILVIGLGSVSRCTLPLMFELIEAAPSQYTVMDFGAVAEDARWVRDHGASFVADRVTKDNYGDLLGQYSGPGDIIVDLAWNIDTVAILEWCRDHGVRYVNASLEVWDPYEGMGSQPPATRTLYARHMRLRQMIAGWGDNHGPTAVLDHGANPGLVSHFTKAGLADIADQWLVDARPGPQRDAVAHARADNSWNLLSEALGVKVIHISERDTQVSAVPKRENEFVNTWSVDGFYEEGIAPAEMGWGTHEKSLPQGAYGHFEGPKNQICIAHPGCRTWVRSWVPCGDIVGMVIRHGEAFSISEALTVTEDGEARYRPTVHYAYCPTDAAVASMHELHMRNYDLQPAQRIMNDDIIGGRDELGCLIMGHPLTSWWIGSLLDINEARRLVPHQNATTLQVAASVLAAVKWLLENPSRGVCLPDDLPHGEILAHALPYLGPFVSRPVDWTPLKGWTDPFTGYGRRRPEPEDVWQFSTFLVTGP
jgi:homospermidine synthase